MCRTCFVGRISFLQIPALGILLMVLDANFWTMIGMSPVLSVARAVVEMDSTNIFNGLSWHRSLGGSNGSFEHLLMKFWQIYK